jgi:S-formylglutathione hydrolase FrmB
MTIFDNRLVNMHRALLWSFFILLSLAVVAAHAQGRIECNVLRSQILQQSVHYCVMLPPTYDSSASGRSPKRFPVLYFLHGLGGSEQTFFQSGGWNLVQDLQQQGQIGDFLIVSPEARTSFYINSANGHVRYSDFFLSEFIPYIESHYSIRKERSARAITGISMGGYGALRFAFADPELFSAVSAQSAALITDSPRELSAAERTGTPLARMLGSVFGNPIDGGHWNQNSPFVLAKKNQIQIKRLAIDFNCGSSDEFGFEKGAAALHRQLQVEGVKHEYHLYPGNHDVAYFMAHLPEVLKFHSKAFASTH